MVRIKCWYCKNNVGNQTCSIHKRITKELWQSCKNYDQMDIKDAEEKVKIGIDTYFEGIDDPDLR